MNDITKNAKNSPNKPFVHLKYRKLGNCWFCYCACKNIWSEFNSHFTQVTKWRSVTIVFLSVCVFTYVRIGIFLFRFTTYTVNSSDVLQDLRLHRCWKIDDDNNKVQQHNDDHPKRFHRCKRYLRCDTGIQHKWLLRQTSFVLVVYHHTPLYIFRDLALCILCISIY